MTNRSALLPARRTVKALLVGIKNDPPKSSCKEFNARATPQLKMATNNNEMIDGFSFMSLYEGKDQPLLVVFSSVFLPLDCYYLLPLLLLLFCYGGLGCDFLFCSSLCDPDGLCSTANRSQGRSLPLPLCFSAFKCSIFRFR